MVSDSVDISSLEETVSCSYLAAYAIMVRSSEYDMAPDVLDDIVERTVSSSRGQDGRNRQRQSDEGFDDDFEYD